MRQVLLNTCSTPVWRWAIVCVTASIAELARSVSEKVALCQLREISALLDGFKQVQLLGMAFVVEMDRVVAGEAGVAEALALAVEVSVHAVAAQVGECVGLDEAADFFHGAVRGDELRAGRRADSLIA